jgi:hypothetical protein
MFASSFWLEYPATTMATTTSTTAEYLSTLTKEDVAIYVGIFACTYYVASRYTTTLFHIGLAGLMTYGIVHIPGTVWIYCNNTMNVLRQMASEKMKTWMS